MSRGVWIAFAIAISSTAWPAVAKPIVTDDLGGLPESHAWHEERSVGNGDSQRGRHDGGSSQPAFSDAQAVYLSTRNGPIGASIGGTHSHFSLDWHGADGFDVLVGAGTDKQPEGPQGGYPIVGDTAHAVVSSYTLHLGDPVETARAVSGPVPQGDVPKAVPEAGTLALVIGGLALVRWRTHRRTR